MLLLLFDVYFSLLLSQACDVIAGGATVFPDIGVKLFPEKVTDLRHVILNSITNFLCEKL